MNTLQIGDGKLPNYYWVSISSDYYYQNTCDDGTHVWDWASDRGEKCTGKTIKRFKTFQEALNFAEQLELNEEFNTILVRCISIEDRLSGQVWERALYEHKEVRLDEETMSDTRFTEEKMKEQGYNFV